MNPPSAGGQPPSFKTNVNRAKTKRWVEAKSYSYDGDDWGEVDDYDEYGGYDEPPPPSRPTGLRQQGQSATQSPPAAYTNRPDVYQNPVDYRQQGHRNSSGPASTQPHYGGQGELHRSDSFRRGDERRVFSAGGAQQGMIPQGNGPPYQSQVPQAQFHPTRFSQMEGINQSRPDASSHNDYPSGQQSLNHPTNNQSGSPRPPLQIQSRLSMDDQSQNPDQAYSPGGNYRGVSYSDQPRHTSMGSRAQSMTSNISSQDFHNRRDFTPSAVPPPLQTRGSPSPNSAGDSQSTARRPPRKDSLSQHAPSNSPYTSQSKPMPGTTDSDDDPPLSRARTGSNNSKPLPFVRPADIYKRMQEEKERKRQSQDSSRPTMDAIMGREVTPTSAHADPSSMDSLGRGQLQRSSFEVSNDGDNNQRLKSTLDPVRERKSEYGFEGFSVNEPGVNSQELPTALNKSETKAPILQSSHQSTLKPVLPDVTRMSGFGESFLDTLSSETPQPAKYEDSSTHLSPQIPVPEASNTDLQHQPSVGFRSIVNQAFDIPEDQIPPTPSSMGDSTIGRSASGGTSVVSPIDISREPSAAATTMNMKSPSARPVTPEAQPSNDHPTISASDSLVTPRQVARKASPSQRPRPGPVEAKAAPFIPGHRRDLSTPSPDNSPARTPILDSTQNLRQPQEAELAMATPVEPEFPMSPSSQSTETAIERQGNLSTSTGPLNISIDPTKARGSVTEPPSLPPDTSRRSRPDSPSSTRVRDLAGKFESASSSPHGSERSLNQRGNPTGMTTQIDVAAEPRPATDRMESFRPRLPGSWDSFASNAPSIAAPKRQEILPKSELRDEHNVPSPSKNPKGDISTPTSTQTSLGGDGNVTPNPNDGSLSKSNESDPLTDPFSATAAAGTALAGALAAAAGIENQGSATSSLKSPSAKESQPGTPRDFQSRGQPTTANVDKEFHPNASKPLPPMVDDDQVSIVTPTPLSKDASQVSSEKVESLEYFPPIIPLNPRPSSYVNNEEPAAVHQRPPMPPSLSTDTGSQFESDRLRREIVKNLNPALSSEPTTAESDSPWQDDSRLSANPSLIRHGHESGVLPSEYDSYWNGSSSASSRTNSGRDHVGAAIAVQRHDGAALVGITSPLNVGSDERAQPPQDKSPLKSAQEQSGIPHRFSWERSLENVAAAPIANPREGALSHTPLNVPPLLAQQSVEGPIELPSGFEHEEHGFHNKGPNQGLDLAGERSHSKFTITPVSGASPIGDVSGTFDVTSEGVADDPNRDLTGIEHSPSYPEGLEVVTPGSGQQQISPVTTSYHNELDHGQSSSPQHEYTYKPELPGQFTASSLGRDGNLPPPPPPSDPPKFPAFREILALKNPTDRIRAFNETRDQFAFLNAGLPQWLGTKIQEMPEHAHLLSNQGSFATGAMSHKSSPSRTKILGLRAAGPPSAQQPYYQQNLRVNSQSMVSEGSPVSTYPGSTLPQGFSPSGGSTVKHSSQQVQAKGKDLLHTAGVFGGKANVAAKGLFSKGRNKLKGGGGADKV